MTPMLQDDVEVHPSSRNVTKANGVLKSYDQLEEAKWQDIASKKIINYGTKFEKNIIVRSSGLYVYNAAGHKVLDWTSGQMSCLVGHGHPEVVETIADHASTLR